MTEPANPAPPAYPDPRQGYLTVAGTGRAEVKVQRSRFLAEVGPASSLAEAKDRVAEVARRYHDSRHVCFAWRGGHGAGVQESRHDAGEPAGTAGEPILAALRSAQVTDCVAVVARYFGGVKLGTGGLARAYGAAAAAALEAAPRKTVWLGREFDLDCAYPLQGTVQRLLERGEGRILAQDFTDRVHLKIWLPEHRWRAFAAELAEATAGAVKLKAPAE